MAESEAIVLTPDGIRKRVEDQKALEKQAAEGRAGLEMLFGYLRLVGKSHWIPEGAETATDSEKGGHRTHRDESRITWTSEIVRALGQHPEGATNDNVREIIRVGPIGDRLRTNPNGYYTGVKRLEESGDLVRYKGRLFTRHLYDAFAEKVRRGEIGDISDDEQLNTAGILVAYINQHPEGIIPKQAVKDLEFQGVSQGAIYNTLSKIAVKGRVRREGGKYYPLNNEAPSGHPEGASKERQDV